MSIQTFITVHDSSILRQCEEEEKFASVSHTYLFVGPRKVDVPNGVDVIRCLDYLPNYEHFPNFYDFTGWFVLAKHGLIQTSNAIFLQYDHSIVDPNIEERTEQHLASHPMIGYSPAPYELWSLILPGFYDKQVEGIAACGVDWVKLLAERPFHTWPSTQGTAWRTEEFNKFMLWFEPAFQVFKDETFCGHLAERMIQPFLMLNGWEAGFLPGLVAHESLDCHGTKDLILGDAASYNQKNSVFGR